MHEILTSFDAIAICVLLALAHWKIWGLLFYIHVHNIYKTAEKAGTYPRFCKWGHPHPKNLDKKKKKKFGEERTMPV